MQGVLFVVLVYLDGVKQEANHACDCHCNIIIHDCDEPEPNHVFQGYMSYTCLVVYTVLLS